MKTLAFINLKGGTGKTVSAANVAHILAAVHHKKVLLVDADKQGNASRYFRRYGEQNGTAALLLGPELVDIAAATYPTEYKGLDIITSNMDLYSTDRELYEDSADTSGTLAAALARVRNDYDFCIIDNGPAVDMVTLNVLTAADDVLIPIRPDEFSFSGLLDLVEQVQAVREGANPGLTIRGAFFTHWQRREPFEAARRSLEDSGICPVFQTAINYNPKVSESTLEETPLCVFAPRSWAAIQYKKLTAEYLDLTDSDKRKEG
ncbi:MAG: ParA family protein [Clostridiales bacterium]|nr:ParA family protein [Clostridiales bacterium]